MDIILESTKIFLNIKGQIKIGISATKQIGKVSDSGEKFDLILLHEILMESNKNNCLELESIDKEQLENIIQDILDNDATLAEDLQKNVLICKDLCDKSDFINNMNKYSLNGLKETIFYKENMDKFSENEALQK
uniref:Uncharacterized protein n=1 Tax=Acrobeloides nanus TaxID=290746 RepID=A0A914CEE7_9BILA